MRINKRLATVAVLGALVGPALFAPPASAAVDGLDVVDVATGSSSMNKSTFAECDPGQRVIGGGAWVAGGSGDVRIVEMIPREDYVFAAAVEDEDGTSSTWSLMVSAICADPLPGLEIVEQVSTRTSNQYNSVAADCTGDNVLLGTGYEIEDHGNQVGLDDLKVTSETRLTGWAYEDDSGYGSTWRLRVFAICADEPAGYERIAVENTNSSADFRTLTADCTGDKVLLGGGGQIDGGSGNVVVDDLYNENHAFTVSAYEDDNGTSSNWHLHAYALCADE